jgi:hypothetical protein
MKTHRMIAAYTCAVLFGAIAFWLPPTAQAYTFLMEAPRYYPVSMCFTPGKEGDLPDYATSTVNALRADGWTGDHYEGASAYPSDFVDQSLGGGYWYGHDSDTGLADAVDLTFFVGHGNNALIGFGYPDPYSGVCTVGGASVPNGIALGWGAGAKSAHAIFTSCCTMNPDYLYNMVANSRVTQMYGFGTVSVVDASMLSNFYWYTSSMSNSWAWFEAMEDRPGVGTGDNSPVVTAAGISGEHAAWMANNCRIRGNVCNTNIYSGYSINVGHYYWWIDHGKGCDKK